MMPKKFKRLEERFIFINEIFLFMRKIQSILKNYSYELSASMRSIGISNSKYKELRQFKNIHKGERCFIIATGPSLIIEDLEKLRDEYTLSMNSVCLIFDQTDWRPTYYGIQDEHVFGKIEKTLKESKLKNIFVSDSIKKKYSILDSWYEFPLNKAYHSYQWRFKQDYFAKFSSDFYKRVYDGYSITYSLIQLAVYMGFKEVFLLGCDNNYSDDRNKQHFVESGHYDPTYKFAGDRMTVGYYEAQKYALANDLKIYNATRGGMLEVFPRVNLDEIL